MKKFSPQSKSFIVLFVIAIVGTYLVVWQDGKQQNNRLNLPPSQQQVPQPGTQDSSSPTASGVEEEPEEAVDTSTWKTYTDPLYGFSFKHDPAWKIKSREDKTIHTYMVEVDPGAKYYNMSIYVTNDSYFAFEGLPIVPANIGSYPAVTVGGLLYGLKQDNVFLTFDVGSSLSLKPKFKAMVQSVSLK